MARFDRQIQTALRLIKKNGQLVQWKQTVKTVDTNEPWIQEETELVLNDVYICFLPVNKEMRELIHYLKGSDVTTGNTLGLMGSVSFIPSSADIVVRDGKELKIDNIDLLSPNGQNILYTIEFIK